MGIFKRIKDCRPHRDENSRTTRSIVLEKLEPRILLSGDGLLNIATSPLEDALLVDNTSQVIQHAELLDTNARAEEQVPSELSDANTYEPLLTLPLEQAEDDGQIGGNAELTDSDILPDDLDITIQNEQLLAVENYADPNNITNDSEESSSDLIVSVGYDDTTDQLTETLLAANPPPARDSIVIAEDEILSGNGVYTGDLINYGTISPGNSPGIITINGNLTIDGTNSVTIDDSYTPPTPTGDDTVGKIQIEIGGLNPGPGAADPSDPDYGNGYDQIIVNGDVTLGGTLEIQLINSFSPSLGDSFEIMTFEDVEGDFTDFVGCELVGDLYLAPLMTADSYRLQVIAAPSGDISSSLNDVIDALLEAHFNPLVDPNPSGEFVFKKAHPYLPNVVTIGQTNGDVTDLQLENVTLKFSLLSFDFIENRWDGMVTVEAAGAVMFPDRLDIVIVDDGFETPRRVESVTPATLLPSGNYKVDFTLSGDHRDGADIMAGYPMTPVMMLLLKSGLSVDDEIAVLNSNESSFDDVDLEDDTKQILVTGVVYDAGTNKTTVTVEYNFNPETGGPWSGGSVIAKADPDIDDDADFNSVGGTIFLGSTPGIDLLKFNTLEATDLGFPIWLDVRVTKMEMQFADFRVDDTDSELRLDAKLLGINTGNEVTNSLLRTGVLGIGLNVEGSVYGIELDMDVLREVVRDPIGSVIYWRNPIKNISGISGNVSGSLFGLGSIDGGFIVRAVKVDPSGAITTVDHPDNRIIMYGAIRVSFALFDGTPNAIDGFALNLAISQLGPLQLFISAETDIPIDPVFTGLQIDEIRGGIRFNSSIDDLQVRPPFGAIAGTVEPSGDLTNPWKITLTVPGHNLKVGDEFRITESGNPNYLSGVNNFIVTEVEGDDISYLVDADPGAFGTPMNIKKISISDPFDLRDPGFFSTKDMSLADWEAQLDQQVVNQANGIPVVNGGLDANFDNVIDYKDNSSIDGYNIIDGKVDIDDSGTIDENDDGTLLGFTVIDGAIDVDSSGYIDSDDDGVLPPADFWDVLFDKVTIEAGATLNFEPRIPDYVLNFEVDLFIDTTGKFLLVGSLNMFNLVSGHEQGNYGFDVPAKLFFDLSELRSGNATFLFLMDVPYVPQNAPGIEPLLVYHGHVTFETLINGAPATLDAATGFPSGVGIDVDDATVTDLSGSDHGPWEVTFTLADGIVPSSEFAVNDIIVVVGSDPSSFNGSHVVTDVDDVAGTISFMIGTAVLNSGIDVDYDGDVDDDDTGSMDGIPVLQGCLDMDRNGTIDVNDDGEVFSVITDVNGDRLVVGYMVIDGFVDIDGDGDVAADPDDVGVIGADPGAWISGSIVANKDDLGNGFRIELGGGVDLNIPFVTTLSLAGDATLDVTLPGPGTPEDARIDFSFNVGLSETNVGFIGMASGAFHVTMDAGNLDDLSGIKLPRIEIWGAAILTTNFEFLKPVGLFAYASGLLRINNTDEVKPNEMLYDGEGNLVAVVALPANTFALRLDGSVDFHIDFDGDGLGEEEVEESVFLIEGIFVLEFSAEQGFNVALFRETGGGSIGPATLQLGPANSRFLTFNVFGFVAIRSDGFAANLILSLDIGAPGPLSGLISLDAQFVFIMNTTGREILFEIPGGASNPGDTRSGLILTIPAAGPANPGALAEASLNDLINGNPWTDMASVGPYGVLFFKGNLTLLYVITLSTSGYVSLTPDLMEMQVEVSGSFLKMINVSGSAFINSNGEFEFIVDGSVQFGISGFNIGGSAHLEVSYLYNSSGGKTLYVEGYVTGGGEIFWVDFTIFELGVSYNSATGDIKLRIGPVPVPAIGWACFWGICVPYPTIKWKYYSFTIGTLKVVAQPPPPIVLGQVNVDGVLTLNVGPDASARNLHVDDPDEDVLIERLSAGSERGEKIRITMFGHSETFDNVLEILIPDMAAGEDYVDIRVGVTVPVEVHFGDDDDILISAGSGVVEAYGDSGADRLTGGSAGDLLFGGLGNDFINGKAGQDQIEGGDGPDLLIGGADDDIINGGAGNDRIAGELAVVTGDETTSILETMGSVLGGNDIIDGGEGADVIMGSSGNDEINGGAGEDLLIGDDGIVTFSLEMGMTYILTDLDFSGNDIIDGGADNDALFGQKGEDILLGGGGDDFLYGDTDAFGTETARNILLGDGGIITMVNGILTIDTTGEEAGGADTIWGNGGADIVMGGAALDMIYGDTGDDILLGDTGMIMLDNGSLVYVDTEDEEFGGSDTIYGDMGDDIIIGGLNSSSDTLYGSAGNDIILGDNGFIDFNVDGDPLTLDLIRSATDGFGGGDSIYGNAGDDVLIGGTGGDRIDGNGGKDLILGDNGVLTYANGDTSNPRFRVLDGTVIYGETPGVNDGLLLIDRDYQFNDPAGIPQWAIWEVTLSFNSGGADYIAGGPDNDQIFGQGDNDIIQGDSTIDTLTPVNAYRDAEGLLVVSASVEDLVDGDDYIEGNDGNDIIFGNLGQDDIIGGSSELFGLDKAAERTDGEDMIFGGAGIDLIRNNQGDTSANGHAQDADVILGDNGNIFRLVGTNGTDSGNFLEFNYDNYGTEKIIVRGTDLIDYTPGGVDYDAVNVANDNGASDEIHGESGDDILYGMKGDDVIFGEGQDDDMIGGYGNDWISGGTGQDGVLGDDGRIYTSRNGIAEPLYGIGDLAGELDKDISTKNKKQQATINVSGELKKTVNLTPFKLGDPEVSQHLDDFDPLQADDIIFGGWGNDFLHGGDGDDAISGAEALTEYYDNPTNPGDVLKYGVYREGEFGAYNKNDPLSKVYWDPATGEFVTGGSVEFLLNFDHTEGPAVDTVNTDGDDVIFGDLGNDWLVGGTGRDHLYGGRGCDLLNADDNLDTTGGTNNEPNGSEASYEDLVFGGAGRDVLMANISGDRLIDWVGDFNRYVSPYTSFGAPTISKKPKPELIEFLYALSRADGADRTLGDSGDPRNGEPNGELGLVTNKDPDWEDQMD